MHQFYQAHFWGTGAFFVDARATASRCAHCLHVITNMLIRVDASSALSLADQIAVQVRAGIANGSLKPAERLPPARDLAAALDINMHTVLRAYKHLRDEGLIEMRQGRGAFVRQDAGPGLVRVTELAEQLINEARKLGMSQQDIVRLIGGAAQA